MSTLGTRAYKLLVPRIGGCEECAELHILEDDYEEDEELRKCPDCGGRMLSIQESFDRIIELKRELEMVGAGSWLEEVTGD